MQFRPCLGGGGGGGGGRGFRIHMKGFYTHAHCDLIQRGCPYDGRIDYSEFLGFRLVYSFQIVKTLMTFA